MGFIYQRMRNMKECLGNFTTSTQEYKKEGGEGKGRSNVKFLYPAKLQWQKRSLSYVHTEE